MKLTTASEEQCKSYALLAIYLYMWDQVLTLVVLLFGIKGLAFEVEQKSFAYPLCLFSILYEGLSFGHLLSVFDRADPSRDELRLLM